ncbi:vitamin B6 photo-protection and homoeostasis-domain-containing protein [Scenedesmus sp. NREL 46B-D3]|nr:vitamin B6 photo-protection and homoeostasis-domain-containing protein [Scenedesmus sp. NREL 46B-D3]
MPDGYTLQRTKGAASSQEFVATKRPSAGGGGSGSVPQQAPATSPLMALLQRPLRRVRKTLQATFLPAGYPTSVGSNYMSYTLWQAVTNFATTANGVLASTFLLYSVGLGAGAIPTAGAMNWVLKDGLGQLGTLLFGKAIAHNFDIHSKTWYFMSFLLLSTATGLEIATILSPQSFLVMGSCANMIKGLSWMAGGSTRSVFNLSFVRDNNIADITAKNTSQYIFASLFGTTAGVSVCAYIGQSAPLALLCFSALAWTSIYSAYRTVKAIPLPTLNSTRLQLLAARYLKCIRTSSTGLVGFGGYMSYQQPAGYVSYQQEYEVPEDEDDTCELELPSPLDLAHQDPPLPWVTADRRILNPAIHVGTQLDKLMQGQPALLVVLLNTFRFQRYLLVPERNAIHMVLHAEAQPRDMVQAYLQACILRKCIKAGVQLPHDNIPELRIILHDTLLAAENLTPPFMRALARQGWQTEKIVVEANRRRARW